MTEPRVEQEANIRRDLESLRIDRGDSTSQPGPRSGGRRLLWLGLAVVGLGVGLLILRAVVGRASPVVVARATRPAAGGEVDIPVLSGSGYVVTADRYISLGVRVAGRIDRYFVEEGQRVREGDPLVQLDDRDYRAAVARAEAALEVARADHALATAQLARGRELQARDFLSQQELDVLETKAEVARATIARIEAELAQAQVNLEYTLLRAPISGVVLAKLKEVGEIAVPGGFAGSGDLVRLANLTDLRAEIDVNEADLNRVRLGQPAEVTPDAYPDARYAAEVVKLYPQVDRQKGTLKVEVRILKADERLLPDMSVRVTFFEPSPPTQGDRPLVLVPAAGVRGDAARGTFVWVVNRGRARRVEVETAGAVGDRVRIARGLDGGEAVVVSDDQGLRDGGSVTVAR